MGRDLNWYVIPRNIEHDTSKPLCLGWEFQKDEEEVRADIYEKVTGKSADFDYVQHEGESSTDYWKRKTKHNEEVQRIPGDYIWGDEKKNDWCPKCMMFARGFFENPIVVHSYDIHHSYSNPCWGSDWNIKGLYIGSSSGDFARLFRNDCMYREIDNNDVKRAKEWINQLGEPRRTSDKESHEETMDVLSFLEKWTTDGQYRVIMDDEC
jgi:hypothetical protein